MFSTSVNGGDRGVECVFILVSTHSTTQWGVFVACVEWTVFVCTHTQGHQWKTAFGAAPQWVKTVMDNG